jgi:hypothetical protein
MSDNSGLNSGWTKLNIITAAFNELGFANYLYDIDPAQLNRVLLQLDGLMGTWAAMGINIGYPLPTSPSGSDINQFSNLPAPAVEAVYMNLAKRIAPSFGKTLAPDAIVNARDSFTAMLLNLSVIPDKQYPGTLQAGAGNKPFNRVFNSGNDSTTPTEII